MPYDLYPAVDEDYNFPPEILDALAKTLQLRNSVVPMSQTQRNNLSSSELWDGRIIVNTTTDRINRYDATLPGWVPVLDVNDISSLLMPLGSGSTYFYDGSGNPPMWLGGNTIVYQKTGRVVTYTITQATVAGLFSANANWRFDLPFPALQWVSMHPIGTYVEMNSGGSPIRRGFVDAQKSGGGIATQGQLSDTNGVTPTVGGHIQVAGTYITAS